MALEMKVYKEIAGYEAKPMFGRTWRQIAALAVMTFGGGGLFAGVTLILLNTGSDLERATDIAMYALFPVLIPAAAWGWWRPMNLKPEQYLGFFLRHHLMKRVIRYEDTYQPRSTSLEGSGEPISSGPPLESAQRTQRGRAAHARALSKTITEHAQQEGRSQTRRKKKGTTPARGN